MCRLNSRRKIRNRRLSCIEKIYYEKIIKFSWIRCFYFCYLEYLYYRVKNILQFNIKNFLIFFIISEVKIPKINLSGILPN